MVGFVNCFSKYHVTYVSIGPMSCDNTSDASFFRFVLYTGPVAHTLGSCPIIFKGGDHMFLRGP